MRGRGVGVLAVVAMATALAGATTAPAQNLVVNPGFESFSTCPPALGQLTGHCDDWYRTGLGSTDYHNTCGFSTRAPRTGEAHLGLIPFDSSADYREYATGRLQSPLEAGQTYVVEFWVVLSEGRLHAIQEMAAWFTDTMPSFVGSGPQPAVVPQVVHAGGTLEDTENWMRVRGTFVAAGGETWITLGNFFTDTDTTSVFFGCCGQHGAYYHLDDVSVVKDVGTAAVEVACRRLGDVCLEDAALSGDGLVDFGELLELEVDVTNVGDVGLTGYQATVQVTGAALLDPPGGAISVPAIAVGETVTVPVTLQVLDEGEGPGCGETLDLALRGQTAEGGLTFSDDDLTPCDAVVDGCRRCRATCLHRSDVTRLHPHAPTRDVVYAPRGPEDVALRAAQYACPFADGDLEPDATVLVDGTPLVLYQVDRDLDTLRLEKAGSTIRFRF